MVDFQSAILDISSILGTLDISQIKSGSIDDTIVEISNSHCVDLCSHMWYLETLDDHAIKKLTFGIFRKHKIRGSHVSGRSKTLHWTSFSGRKVEETRCVEI